MKLLNRLFQSLYIILAQHGEAKARRELRLRGLEHLLRDERDQWWITRR